MENNFISVIICTYNRCGFLKDTLDSFIEQENDSNFNYEVIVVDNNSKDRTRELLESFKPKFNGRLRYFFEPLQGLSYARNRGIHEARGEIIVFTDDDCVAYKDWIYKIWKKFKEDKKLDLILGRAIWDNGDEMFPDNKDILRGNGLNMSFRKSSILDIGDFDVNLGSGSVGCSAEDTDFVYRAVKKNKKIAICNDIIVIHKQRQAANKKLKYLYRDFKGFVIFELKHFFDQKEILFLKEIYWLILRIIKRLFVAIKEKDKNQIKIRLTQLTAVFIGLIKGFYVWLILVPFKSLCRK